MKKIYKAPLIEVVKVNAEQMICISGQVGQGGPFGGDANEIQSLGDEQYDDFDW